MSGTEVKLAGLVAASRAVKTKCGGLMAHVTLEDLAGTVEVVVFPDLYTTCRANLEVGTVVVVAGRVESGEDSAKIIATELIPIAEARLRGVREVAVSLEAASVDKKLLEALKRVVETYHGGAPVRYEIVRDGAFRARLATRTAAHIDPSPQAVAALEAVVGQGRVTIVRGGARG